MKYDAHVLQSSMKVPYKQVPVGTTMRPGSGLRVAEEEEVVVVVGSIDSPHEAWGCVIYWFLVKFIDDKKNWLRTDRRTDGPTDGHTLL